MSRFLSEDDKQLCHGKSTLLTYNMIDHGSDVSTFLDYNLNLYQLDYGPVLLNSTAQWEAVMLRRNTFLHSIRWGLFKTRY